MSGNFDGEGARWRVAPWLIWAGLVIQFTGCFNRPPAHGTAISLEPDVSGLSSESQREQAVNATLKALQKRLKTLSERFSIEPQGTNGLLLKLRAVPEAELIALRLLVCRRGRLEFCLVHEGSEELLSASNSESGYLKLGLKQKSSDGQEVTRNYLVKQKPEMTGGIRHALVTRGSHGGPEIAFWFDSTGAKRFAEITRNNIGRQLAIVLDGDLYSAPVIQSAIEQGSGVISGHFDRRQAFELAAVLQSPLPVPVRITAERAF